MEKKKKKKESRLTEKKEEEERKKIRIKKEERPHEGEEETHEPSIGTQLLDSRFPSLNSSF